MRGWVLFLLLGLAACSDQDQAKDPATEPAQQSVTKTPAASAAEGLGSGVDTSNPNWRQSLSLPAQQAFVAGAEYLWVMETNKGVMEFRLLPEVAPMHVTSTIYLTELGFYDNLIFHRVIPGFMAQGGDPTGTGRGGPGYQYDGEFAEGVVHDKAGLLSMANAGPGTDGSQFFITFKATPWLDGKHTIFGEIVSGMEVLDAFEAAGSRSGQVSEPLQILKASILQQ